MSDQMAPEWSDVAWNMENATALAQRAKTALGRVEETQATQRFILVDRDTIPAGQRHEAELASMGEWEDGIAQIFGSRHMADDSLRYSVQFLSKTEIDALIAAHPELYTRDNTIVVSTKDKIGSGIFGDATRLLAVQASAGQRQFVNIAGIVALAAALVDLNQPAGEIPADYLAEIGELYRLLTGETKELNATVLTDLFNNPVAFAKWFVVTLPGAQRFEPKELRQLHEHALEALRAA